MDTEHDTPGTSAERVQDAAFRSVIRGATAARDWRLVEATLTVYGRVLEAREGAVAQPTDTTRTC